jgi:hypothetical protein
MRGRKSWGLEETPDSIARDLGKSARNKVGEQHAGHGRDSHVGGSPCRPGRQDRVVVILDVEGGSSLDGMEKGTRRRVMVRRRWWW